MRLISKLNRLKIMPKLLAIKVRKLYVKRPMLVIICILAGFLLVGTSTYAVYKVIYSSDSQTITTDTQKPEPEQTAQPISGTNESRANEGTGEDKKSDVPQKSTNTSNSQSSSTSSKPPAINNQPNNPPTSTVPPYYGAVLPPTVTKTDNGATMTYTIALTIIPNETFGNPMIRLQLFHPGICINNSELTRIYRYNNQNTLSMGCTIDKSQPAYGMTNLNLDFSIYKDNGEAIHGAASGWTHVLPQNYNQ